MKRFSSYVNVIPTLEAENGSFYTGMLTALEASITSMSDSYAYYVKASSFQLIEKEVDSLITEKDY